MNKYSYSVSVFLLLAALTACGDDKHVLATVNGKTITQEQFDAYLALKRIPFTDEKRRSKALEEFLDREGMAALIEKEGKLNQATIEAEVNEFRKEMLISRHFDQFLEESVDEKQVQDSYSSEAGQYEKQKVHAAHILIRTNKRMSEEQRKAKLTTAQEIYAKLQSGEAFETLASQFSEDKISGKRAGDLGWIKEGTIDERFSKRAFSLKAGSVTEPFETPFGFHILKVIEEPKTIRRPLGAVAGEIRYRLRSEAKEKELERLKKGIKVEKKGAYKESLSPKPEPEKLKATPSKPDGVDPSEAPGARTIQPGDDVDAPGIEPAPAPPKPPTAQPVPPKAPPTARPVPPKAPPPAPKAPNPTAAPQPSTPPPSPAP